MRRLGRRLALRLAVGLGFGLALRLGALGRGPIRRQLVDGQPVQRAGGAEHVLATAMQINHRRGEAGVPEQPADRQQVHARLEQPGRVGMA